MPKISGWERQQSSEDDEVVRVWTSDKEDVEAQVRKGDTGVRESDKDWVFGVFHIYSEGFLHRTEFENQQDAIDHATDYLKNHTYFGVEK